MWPCLSRGVHRSLVPFLSRTCRLVSYLPQKVRMADGSGNCADDSLLTDLVNLFNVFPSDLDFVYKDLLYSSARRSSGQPSRLSPTALRALGASAWMSRRVPMMFQPFCLQERRSCCPMYGLSARRWCKEGGPDVFYFCPSIRRIHPPHFAGLVPLFVVHASRFLL